MAMDFVSGGPGGKCDDAVSALSSPTDASRRGTAPEHQASPGVDWEPFLGMHPICTLLLIRVARHLTTHLDLPLSCNSCVLPAHHWLEALTRKERGPEVDSSQGFGGRLASGHAQHLESPQVDLEPKSNPV